MPGSSKHAKFKTYSRATVISSVITLSAIFSIWGVCAAYEGTRDVGFGDKKSAIELIYGADGGIEAFRFLDFEMRLPYLLNTKDVLE